jgi:hypothetical protein
MADKKISALTGASTPLAGTEVLPIVQSGATVKVAVSDLTAGRAVSASSLTTTGNVGIGTSPTVKLDVSSTYVSDTAVQQRFYDNTGGALNFGGTGGANKFIQVQDTTTATYYPLLLNPLGGDVKVGANLVISTSGKGIDFSATPGTGTSELFADYEEGTWTPSFVGSGSYPWTFTITNSIYTKVGRLVYVNCYGTMTATNTTTADNFYIGGVPFASANCKLAGEVTIDGASNTIYFLAASNLFSNTAVIPVTLAGNSRAFSIFATYSV